MSRSLSTLLFGCWANATTEMPTTVSLLNNLCSFLYQHANYLESSVKLSVKISFSLSLLSPPLPPVDSGYTTVEGAPPHILAFMEHYNSIPWMTYRANFSQIRGTNLSTDCGWGCMVRSGQMILATALHRHLLNQEWRFTSSSVKDLGMHKQVRKFLKPTLNYFMGCGVKCMHPHMKGACVSIIHYCIVCTAC